MVADPIVQIDQMQGLVLENLYSGAQSGSLMVQINAYQQIRSITVTNNLVKLSILNQQTTKSITVSYTCSFID